MHKLAAHGKATVSDITLMQRPREVTKPWLPAASIPILITLLTALLFQLSSCLAPKDGNTVIVKNMGESLNKVVVVRGIKLPVKVPFAQQPNLSPKKFVLTSNKNQRSSLLIPSLLQFLHCFLRQLQLRECVFCTNGGKDYYEGADLKYNLQHCPLMISSSNLQTC